MYLNTKILIKIIICGFLYSVYIWTFSVAVSNTSITIAVIYNNVFPLIFTTLKIIRKKMYKNNLEVSKEEIAGITFCISILIYLFFVCDKMEHIYGNLVALIGGICGTLYF